MQGRRGGSHLRRDLSLVQKAAGRLRTPWDRCRQEAYCLLRACLLGGYFQANGGFGIAGSAGKCYIHYVTIHDVTKFVKGRGYAFYWWTQSGAFNPTSRRRSRHFRPKQASATRKVDRFFDQGIQARFRRSHREARSLIFFRPEFCVGQP